MNTENKCAVVITERFSKTFVVNTLDPERVLESIKDEYGLGKIVLDSSNYLDTTIEIVKQAKICPRCQTVEIASDAKYCGICILEMFF